MLTKRQYEAFEFIKSFIAEKGYGPSLQEIADACNFGSKSRVFYVLKDLERRDFIRRLPHRRRAIQIVPHDEVTPAMIRAGGMALLDGPPDEWQENPGVAAVRVFKAMLMARMA